MASVQELAQQWLALDRDETTCQEIQDLVDAHDETELELRLRSRIAFGTAGLRASMKAGFAFMNSLTVAQASYGLAQYVLDRRADLASIPSVVVGYDARHNSERFARLAAATFLATGLKVLWYGRLVHTPLVPFAVQRYGAAAGVMVTASHNPKTDNGYKVYLSNGCQIIPPHDVGIADAICTLAKEPVPTWDYDAVDRSANVTVIAETAISRYLVTVEELMSPLVPLVKPLNFAYTPLHGVGLTLMREVAQFLRRSNSSMVVVESQASPDPDFPTLPFPNPEEKGTLDEAIETAKGNDCALIIANDPDADRFAVAQRLNNGHWHQFTGDEVGVLFAAYICETYPHDKSRMAMLASTVSSSMLASMASVEGFHFQETLTGFKWLGNVAQDLDTAGYDVQFAYEEAIGYMFPRVVWDKDGIAAAAVFLAACIHWQHHQNTTPMQKLQRLYAIYGHHRNANTYLISPSRATTDRAFASIRTHYHAAATATDPTPHIGTRSIRRWRDLTTGFDSGTPDTQPVLPVDPATHMITCHLDAAVSVTARASGTEPKIKLYIEARAESALRAKTVAEEVRADVLREWFSTDLGLRVAGS